MKTRKGCLQELIQEVSKEELLKRFGNKKAQPFKGEEKKEEKESPEKPDKEKEEKETPDKSDEKKEDK